MAVESRTSGKNGALTSLGGRGALVALGSSLRGLDEADVATRLAAFGRNVLPPARHRPVVAEIASQFANMFAVMLMVAAGLTFLTYRLSVPRNVANLELTLGILAVVELNVLIGCTQEHAVERTAEALQGMRTRVTQVLRPASSPI